MRCCIPKSVLICIGFSADTCPYSAQAWEDVAETLILLQVTHLDFAPEHAGSYNELIEVIKLNLLLADWNDEDHNESLLSTRNSKWGKEMLRNVR